MATTSLGRLTLDLVAQVGQFTDPLDKAERKARDSSKKIGNSFSEIGTMASKAMPMVAGLAGSIAGLAASYVTLDKVIGAQRTYDKQIAGLETATKSANNAKEAYAALSKFAKETPYGMDQAVEAFTKLVNLGLTPSERALKSYGNTASAMGKDLMQFIEAVADASTGEFERLKEFGIKASKQGDQVAFTFQGTTKKIKNNAASIEEYLMKIGENEFAGAMKKRMDSLDGDLANLEDSWNDLYISISKAGVGNLIRDATKIASNGVQDLSNLVSSGAIETALAGMGKAFSVFGGDAKTEMREIAKSFGLTSDYLVEKWKATIEELNALGNTWTLLRSWVQKAAVSVAAGVDIISDPFNKRSSNSSKQSAWESSLLAIENETVGRWNAVSNGIGDAEKKYKEYIATQAKGNKSGEDALLRYAIKAKSAGDTASDGAKKANKELEKQKKLIEGLGNGLVSNANLKGLTIKSAESISGGKIRGYTAEFAQLTNSALGNSINRFTAFNDSYHKGTNSKHATGNAFDLTVKDAKEAQSAVNILQDVAKKYGYSVRILNEYTNPSARATGGHLHVSVLGKNAKVAWKDIQDEVDLIGKGHDATLKLDEDLIKKRLGIFKTYASDLQKIEYDNTEAIKEIESAYTVDDTNRQKYLDLQKLVYQKDLKEFEKTQEAKRIAAYNSINDPINSMRDKGVEARAQASMTPMQYQSWQLNSEQQDGYSQLGNDLMDAVNAINESQILSEQEKYDQLEKAHKDYVNNKSALDVLYDKQTKDLARSQQIEQVNMWGGILSTGQNTFSQLAQSAKDGLGEQSSTYRTMFAMQQAFSVASSMVAAWTAYTTAFADPSAMTLTQKFAGGAAVMAALMPALTTIGSISIQGMAHNGIDNIPSEGTWLLDGGERVLNPQQNKDLTRYLSESRSNQNSQSAQVSVNPQIVILDERKAMGDYLQSREGEQIILKTLKRNGYAR
ncbi:MAG: tape measure protein [Pseudomonadota bacterium]|nr:tape measure protein [Pseudomonadota bacterium]